MLRSAPCALNGNIADDRSSMTTTDWRHAALLDVGLADDVLCRLEAVPRAALRLDVVSDH